MLVSQIIKREFFEKMTGCWRKKDFGVGLTIEHGQSFVHGWFIEIFDFRSTIGQLDYI